jgi:plastocyanin
MKRLLALALVLAAAAAAAAIAVPAFAATKTVTVGDNFFRPTQLSVPAGTNVVWKWTGRNPHNVTVTGGPKKFHSKTQTSGTYAATPRTKGTYSIVCTIHGFTMKLVVR